MCWAPDRCARCVRIEWLRGDRAHVYQGGMNTQAKAEGRAAVKLGVNLEIGILCDFFKRNANASGVTDSNLSSITLCHCPTKAAAAPAKPKMALVIVPAGVVGGQVIRVCGYCSCVDSTGFGSSPHGRLPILRVCGCQSRV